MCNHEWVRQPIVAWDECHEGGDVVVLHNGFGNGVLGETCQLCGQIYGSEEKNKNIVAARKILDGFHTSKNAHL